jgi:hypothetical protein
VKEREREIKEMMMSQASCFWEERLKNQKTKGVVSFLSLFYFCIFFYLQSFAEEIKL